MSDVPNRDLPASAVAESLGFRVLGFDAAKGQVRCGFTCGTQHTNPRGQVHGGFIAGMLDISGIAAAMLVAGEDSTFATVQMSISYLLPVPVGDVQAVARVTRRGRAFCFVEAQLLSASDLPMAKALLVCSQIPPASAP